MNSPLSRTLLALAVLLVAAAACSRDRSAGPDEVTAAEWAAFAIPADSAITAEQVERYLRTATAQVELLRRDASSVENAEDAVVPTREQKPGSAPKRPRTVQSRWSDLVDATFVHAARAEGYSPAEMWYVRDRMAAVSGHLRARQMHGTKDEMAALFREQAEAMRGAPGVDDAQIQAMLAAATQAEEQAPPPVSEAATRNAAVLRHARPSLDAEAWERIASLAGGAEISALATAPSPERERALEALGTLLRNALEDRPPAR